MHHVEVRHTHLFTWSLLQLGVVMIGAWVMLSLVVGLVIWRRGRRWR